MQRLAGEVGDVDILINNAGIALFGPTADFEVGAFDRMFASNVRAPFLLVAALAPGMAARRTGSSVSSMAGTATPELADERAHENAGISRTRHRSAL